MADSSIRLIMRSSTAPAAGFVARLLLLLAMTMASSATDAVRYCTTPYIGLLILAESKAESKARPSPQTPLAITGIAAVVSSYRYPASS